MTTSDGIQSEDWNAVEALAEEIATAVCSDIDATVLIKQLLAYLRKLSSKYGRLPSIIATQADYTEDVIARLSLLKEAYVTAGELRDLKNLSYISAGLAEIYDEDILNPELRDHWIRLLGGHLSQYSDDYLESIHSEGIQRSLSSHS